MRNEEEALFGSSDDFFRLRQSPRVQMIAWLLSQSWRDSLVTRVRVGVEFHISHCWQDSVSHPLFILKALFSPSLCVLTGGGKRMNSVFPMVHWSLGPGSFNLKSQKWLFPQEQMAPIASLVAMYPCLLHHSILKSGVPWNQPSQRHPNTNSVFHLKKKKKRTTIGGGRTASCSVLFCFRFLNIIKRKKQVSTYVNT